MSCLGEEKVKEKVDALKARLQEIEKAFGQKQQGISAAQQTIQQLNTEAVQLEKEAISINGSIAALEDVLRGEVAEETVAETA